MVRIYLIQNYPVVVMLSYEKVICDDGKEGEILESQKNGELYCEIIDQNFNLDKKYSL